MRKDRTRFVAVFMAFIMMISVMTPVNIYAAKANLGTTVQKDIDETISMNEVEKQVSANTAEGEEFGEKDKLNYLYLDSHYIETPGSVPVLIGFGDEDTVISHGTLTVENFRTKEQKQFYSEEAMENSILFSLEYTAEDKGIYEVVAVSITDENGKSKEVRLSQTGMDAVYFGVDEEVVESEEDPQMLEESVEMQIITFDEGNVSDADSKEIADAVEEAIGEAETNSNRDAENVPMPLSLDDDLDNVDANTSSRQAGGLVVVLDPGHDATHAGARANGLKEEELTLKIAQYCKQELEKYSGVTVYMTRTSNSCPHPGTSSTDDNAQRVAYAQSVGADVFVSIHLNSSTSSSPNGAEVFYPNANYNSSIGNMGANLATQIERQLVALGLGNRGISIRNSGDNTQYPDGSLADYYGVIRRSKLAGFPAVIIEHAFLTNPSDAAFLSKEENLKKLGIADATGIVNYYGLNVNYNFKSDALSVYNVNNAAGTFSASISNITPASAVKEVQFAVWSKSDQSDLKWYVAKNTGGVYSANINIANHGKNAGMYQVHAYVQAVNNRQYYLSGTTANISEPEMKFGDLRAIVNSNGNVVITATGTGFDSLQFAVWSNVNGQDDLVYYPAKLIGTGTWSAVIPLSKHKSTGSYQVHAYGTNAYRTKYLGGSSFSYSGPKASSVAASNVNNGTGRFTVTANGVTSSSAITKVEVAVWSQSNQSDLKWYTATKTADGAYAANVDIANHNYNYGSYSAHVYVTDSAGICSYVGATGVLMSQPTARITAVGNGNQTQYALRADQVGIPGGVSKVEFAVWSEAGEQDDLVWYTGKNAGNGTWTANAVISNHKTAGRYQVHVYATNRAGKATFIGTTTFSVKGPSATSVTASNANATRGTFTVTVTGVTSAAPVQKVEIAVWSQSNQRDIKWYTATKAAEGTYAINADIANHGYNYGSYSAHVYVTDSAGICSYVGATGVLMSQPTARITAVGNGNQTQYVLRADQVGIPGGVSKVEFAVWSEAGGQDDLVWYTGKNAGNGTWTANAVISNHKTAGRYQVHVYATNRAGKATFIGTTTFSVKGPSATSVTASNANATRGTFTVTVTGVTSAAPVQKVEVAVWSQSNQSDIKWYTATKAAEGTYAINADIANHGYNYGSYSAHVYATDSAGICSYVGATGVLMSQPTARITAVGNGNQTQYALRADQVGIPGGVSKVEFAVWSEAGGQDDLVWYTGKNAGNGTWTANAVISNHKTAGRYQVHVYVTNGAGKDVFIGTTTYVVDMPKVQSVKIAGKNESDGTFSVQISGITSVSGVSKIEAGVWCASNQRDMLWYNATNQGNGSYYVGVDVRNHQNNTGTYRAHVYLTAGNGVEVYAGAVSCSIINVTNILHPIAGSSSVTVDQMVAYYNSVTSYPGYYANTEAPTIRQFCQIYLDECNKEGIKAEVAFVQAMKETNFLRYGGDVDISQYNFAGMGATGNGVPGNAFPSVTIGIRAHIQHLKAYASNEGLNGSCVDPRFQYVSRNTAPYCEWLGINENPYKKGWATAVNYGYNIVERMNRLKSF